MRSGRIEAVGAEILAMVAEVPDITLVEITGSARARARAALRPLDGASLLPSPRLVVQRRMARPVGKSVASGFVRSCTNVSGVSGALALAMMEIRASWPS